MKNMKVTTKLAFGFAIIDILLVISMYFGYTSAAQIVNVEDPKAYLSSFGTFTAIEFIIMLIITGGISVYMTKTIKGALAEISKAADALAKGNVDIKLEKQSNDEFGQLVDDFQKVVENTRYQTQIIQELAAGNMTVEAHQRSEQDVMDMH